MPIRSGAIQRPSDCRYGNMLRQRYDEVGLPCCNTMGSPSPTSTYAISLPRTCRRFFWYGNAAEIMFASPTQIPQAMGVLLGSPLTARLPINFRHDSWFAIVNISQYLFVTDDPVIQRHRHIRKAGPCTRRYEHSATRCQRGTHCPWHFAGKEI